MDRLLQERVHDPYKTRQKLPEPTVCPVCNAVYRSGRWQWADAWPMDAHTELCQACRRRKDNYPAGVVALTGDVVRHHRSEMLNLVRHLESEERAEHPMNRIMGIEEYSNRLVISTTDVHLPRRLGQAIHHAYKGTLDRHYDHEGCFVRVNWTSET
jgi:NMD protein affecting ribosome stability and mRNA decay